MKYPWVAIALAIIWFSSTYIILKGENFNTTTLLFSAIIGTLIVAVIGFSSPTIKK